MTHFFCLLGFDVLRITLGLTVKWCTVAVFEHVLAVWYKRFYVIFRESYI